MSRPSSSDRSEIESILRIIKHEVCTNHRTESTSLHAGGFHSFIEGQAGIVLPVIVRDPSVERQKNDRVSRHPFAGSYSVLWGFAKTSLSRKNTVNSVFYATSD